MEKSIDFIKKNQCCGCSACVQKCPKNAISLKEDEEGFFYPIVNKEKCINCGLCKKVCPFINYEVEQKENYPKAYAVKNKINKDILNSSSGGVFIAIAKYIIKENGVVFGAANDENNKVNHISVERE